jgi:hypothetical protein
MGQWLAKRLVDRRRQDLITHPLVELLYTSLFLLASGWRDQDDTDALRGDAALRLAVSTRRGTAPLTSPPSDAKRDRVPDGLASQPTLSRLIDMMSSEENRRTLREGLLETAARRIRAMRRGHRPRYITIDVDSLPVEVYGHQPMAEYNGHYHATIYHPLVASIGETGDLVDARLRRGAAHTAEGALDFIVDLLDRVESKLCQVADVRIDAGFPEDGLLTALEARGTPYVARVRNNPVLDRMAEPFLKRPVGRPPAELRTWFHELHYRAEKWSCERRAVLVVQERPGELFLHHFWILTSWRPEQYGAEDLLELYRVRGAAEGYMGELMSVLAPALSSSPRPKSHYRGEPPKKTSPSCDSFAHNEALLLLNALAYDLMHVARVLLEQATDDGWSVKRLRERVLRVAARILLHARSVTIVVESACADLWRALTSRLARLRYDEA